MLRKILLKASLPLIALPLTCLAASAKVAPPAPAASLSSQLMPLSGALRNNPVLISQYYPDPDDRRAEYWRRVREHQRRCENFREYLLSNRDSYSPRELHDRWERFHRYCDEGDEGDRGYGGYGGDRGY